VLLTPEEDIMKLQWLLPIALITAVAFAGCLGGESKEEGEPMYEVFTDSMELVGGQTGLAQASPVEIYANVPIQMDFDRIIKIQINISVEDGDDQTNPDSVGMMEFSEVVTEGEGNVTTVNGGNTPLSTQVVVEWQSGEYLGAQWNLYIPVTIEGGADTWPGPIIWRGVPDRGFGYSLEVTYEYHEEPLE
jgi:hypothetical protein